MNELTTSLPPPATTAGPRHSRRDADADADQVGDGDAVRSRGEPSRLHELEQLYRATVGPVTAYFARRTQDPQLAAPSQGPAVAQHLREQPGELHPVGLELPLLLRDRVQTSSPRPRPDRSTSTARPIEVPTAHDRRSGARMGRPGGGLRPRGRQRSRRVSVNQPCAARRGLHHRCELAVLHGGDHASGDVRWPRSPREQSAYERDRAELDRLREQVLRRPPRHL